jgi:hypothetical protein
VRSSVAEAASEDPPVSGSVSAQVSPVQYGNTAQIDLSLEYRIVSIVSGKPVMTKSTGRVAQFEQRPGVNPPDDLWRFEQVRGAQDGYYHIVQVATGKCLDVADGSLEDHAAVNVYACDGSASPSGNQVWRAFEAQPIEGDPFKSIEEALGSLGAKPDHGLKYVGLQVWHSGKVLDLPGSAPENGVELQQFDYRASKNQFWALWPSPPPASRPVEGECKIEQFVEVSEGNGVRSGVFRVRAMGGDYAYLDHPFLNGRSDVMITVTPVDDPVDDDTLKPSRDGWGMPAPPSASMSFNRSRGMWLPHSVVPMTSPAFRAKFWSGTFIVHAVMPRRLDPSLGQ